MTINREIISDLAGMVLLLMLIWDSYRLRCRVSRLERRISKYSLP